MPESVLALSGATKTVRTPFSRRPGFRVGPLDLTIGRAEIVGLIGANGAGKTTTIKLILGLLVPDQGRIDLVGSPSTENAWRSRVSYLPEQPAFYEYLSGFEFVRFMGRLFDMEGRSLDAKVNQLLDRVGLSDSRHRAIRTYSKGMLQRLGLAQALINDPQLLIMDEPMSGLDPLGRRFVRDLLLELRAEGRSVLFSTHIIPDAEYVCDRVALMRGGQLAAVGTFDELLGIPRQFEVVSVKPPAADASATPGGQDDRRVSLRVDRDELVAAISAVVAQGAQLVGVTPVRKTVEDLLTPVTKGGN